MELIFTRGYYNGAYIREVKNDVIFAWMKWSEVLSRGFEWMERPWRRGSNGATFAAGVRMERPPRGGFEWCDMHGGGSNGATFVARGSNGSSFAGIKVAKRLLACLISNMRGLVLSLSSGGAHQRANKAKPSQKVKASTARTPFLPGGG